MRTELTVLLLFDAPTEVSAVKVDEEEDEDGAAFSSASKRTAGRKTALALQLETSGRASGFAAHAIVKRTLVMNELTDPTNDCKLRAKANAASTSSFLLGVRHFSEVRSTRILTGRPGAARSRALASHVMDVVIGACFVPTNGDDFADVFTSSFPFDLEVRTRTSAGELPVPRKISTVQDDCTVQKYSITVVTTFVVVTFEIIEPTLVSVATFGPSTSRLASRE